MEPPYFLRRGFTRGEENKAAPLEASIEEELTRGRAQRAIPVNVQLLVAGSRSASERNFVGCGIRVRLIYQFAELVGQL